MKLTSQDKATIRKLYADGFTLREIKDRFPSYSYRQLQYYATSASIYRRSENTKLAALRQGARR